eukprot:1768043-Rhodomonas_salina.3
MAGRGAADTGSVGLVTEGASDVWREGQVEALEELERQYNLAIKDPEFIAEVARSGGGERGLVGIWCCGGGEDEGKRVTGRLASGRYRKEYIGGPTPTYFAKRLTEQMGGAQIWLKREELAHTGPRPR